MNFRSSKHGVQSRCIPGHRCLLISCLLSLANDRVLLFDKIHAKVSFPSFITVTSLRPDIVLYSVSQCIVAWVELTVCVSRIVSRGSCLCQPREEDEDI